MSNDMNFNPIFTFRRVITIHSKIIFCITFFDLLQSLKWISALLALLYTCRLLQVAVVILLISCESLKYIGRWFCSVNLPADSKTCPPAEFFLEKYLHRKCNSTENATRCAGRLRYCDLTGIPSWTPWNQRNICCHKEAHDASHMRWVLRYRILQSFRKGLRRWFLLFTEDNRPGLNNRGRIFEKS